MKWFRNMKIKAKMILSFFVLIALMIGLSLFAIVQLNGIHNQNQYASEFPAEREVTILELQINSRDMRRITSALGMYAPLNDHGNVEALIAEGAEAFNTCMHLLDKYDSLLTNDPHLEKAYMKQRLEKINNLRELLVTYKRDIFDAAAERAIISDHAGVVAVAEATGPIVAAMRDSIIELVEYANTVAKNADITTAAGVDRAIVLIIVIAAVAALMAVVISLYVSSLLSRPLIPLSAFMKKAGTTGDIEMTAEDHKCITKFGKNKDEIGDTIKGAAAFVNHVTKIAGELEIIANGDLTHEIKLLSQADKMGTSLRRMVENLNNMFGEINLSTNQVSSSSKQLAVGAQVLAQGSTEQAASIQQLSSSISEIAERTKENAKIAEKTSELSTTIKESAEHGSRQMGEMMTAVRDINDASHSISKIIKTIDDIAFQTNILALNASVEAARAGQYGQGFAVVAEEVRNLASKSAEAAKDTGNMIQDSMDKAELGSRIAGDTAASLNDIVARIKESTHLIDEITSASKYQSASIAQVNVGIDQVAQVIQQNSATAEESAAASMEMSGQSSMLQQLITQFKIREG